MSIFREKTVRKTAVGKHGVDSLHCRECRNDREVSSLPEGMQKVKRSMVKSNVINHSIFQERSWIKDLKFKFWSANILSATKESHCMPYTYVYRYILFVFILSKPAKKQDKNKRCCTRKKDTGQVYICC